MEHWSNARLTQQQLAAAFSAEEPLSAASVASWESRTVPKLPQRQRLLAYARFFATPRSVAEIPRLLPLEELNEDEQAAYTKLEAELLTLWRRVIEYQEELAIGQYHRTNQMVRHAFISYVREDVGHVDRLQRLLEDAGIRVWRDTADLWPGEDWRTRIRQAIQSDALVFIACFSKQSVTRSRSYQNEELVLAIEQLRLRPPGDPWLIPVRFNECDIPDFDIGMGRTLRSIQCANLFGDRADEAAERLVASVRRILGPTGPSSTEAK